MTRSIFVPAKTFREESLKYKVKSCSPITAPNKLGAATMAKQYITRVFGFMLFVLYLELAPTMDKGYCRKGNPEKDYYCQARKPCSMNRLAFRKSRKKSYCENNQSSSKCSTAAPDSSNHTHRNYSLYT